MNEGQTIQVVMPRLRFSVWTQEPLTKADIKYVMKWLREVAKDLNEEAASVTPENYAKAFSSGVTGGGWAE